MKKKPKFLQQIIEITVTERWEYGPFDCEDTIIASVSSDISHLKSPTNKDLSSGLFEAKIAVGRLLAKRKGGAGRPNPKPPKRRRGKA